MPQPRIPKLVRHKASGRAVARIGGHDRYFGPWPEGAKGPPPDVQAAYDRAVSEWLANGRRLPAEGRNGGPPGVSAATPTAGPTVDEVILAFWRHAERHYRHPDGSPTRELDNYLDALRPLRRLYGGTAADSFGPLALKAVRETMTSAGLARTVINQRVGKIKRVFKWAASEELIPVAVSLALGTVAGLQKGRSDARESQPVGPADDRHVEMTLPFLTPTLRAMTRFLRLTGCRPGEAMALRADLIDRPRVVGLRRVTAPDGVAQDGEVIERPGPLWYYRPGRHKTSHKGKGRVVVIGPRGQELLAPFLLAAGPDGYVFSPARSVREFRAARTKGERKPRERYTRWSFNTAIERACLRAAVADLAERHPGLLAPVRTAESVLKAAESAVRKATREGRPNALATARAARAAYRQAVTAAARAGDSVLPWAPNQLRHASATEVRMKFGVEAARTVLGHTKIGTTELYAERDLSLATRVAREVG
jgi:integrase